MSEPSPVSSLPYARPDLPGAKQYDISILVNSLLQVALALAITGFMIWMSWVVLGPTGHRWAWLSVQFFLEVPLYGVLSALAFFGGLHRFYGRRRMLYPLYAAGILIQCATNMSLMIVRLQPTIRPFVLIPFFLLTILINPSLVVMTFRLFRKNRESPISRGFEVVAAPIPDSEDLNEPFVSK